MARSWTSGTEIEARESEDDDHRKLAGDPMRDEIHGNYVHEPAVSATSIFLRESERKYT
jgi:hypothetical protein